MIHHLSIAAKNPLHVATVLAEICHGRVTAVLSTSRSYAVLTDDDYGTQIEVYPRGTELMPGQGQEQVVYIQSRFTPMFTATHALLSVPSSEEQIQQIGQREGWRVLKSDRGSFEVIEFWIENKLLLELLPPTISLRYPQGVAHRSTQSDLGDRTG